MVLERSRFAVLGYKCSISATPVGKLLQFHKCDGLATEWFSVLDYKQWRSYEVLVKPPAHVIAHGMAPGVGLAAADAVPLLHRCASLGFNDVGVSCLNRLLRLLPAGTGAHLQLERAQGTNKTIDCCRVILA